MYEPPPNLPPACSFVITNSEPREATLAFGVDGDASPIVLDLDRTIWVEEHRDQRAMTARASSTELSMISHRQCMRPRESVEPMYMPGRLRTASRPSSTERLRAVCPASWLPRKETILTTFNAPRLAHRVESHVKRFWRASPDFGPKE